MTFSKNTISGIIATAIGGVLVLLATPYITSSPAPDSRNLEEGQHRKPPPATSKNLQQESLSAVTPKTAEKSPTLSVNLSPIDTLRGKWTGEGEQFDTNSSWTIELNFIEDIVHIRYPSLNCGGRLNILTAREHRFEFREKIEYGRCVNNGRVVLDRASEFEFSYKWYSPAGTYLAKGNLVKSPSE